MKFYFVYPLVAYSAFRLLSRKFFLSISILAIALFYVSISMGNKNLWAEKADCFLFLIAGFFSGVIFKKYDFNQIKFVNWDIVAIASLLAFCFCIGIFHFSALPLEQLLSFVWILAPLISIGILSIGLSKGWISWLFANPLSRFLGQISYSLYLVHSFIINMVSSMFPKFLQVSLLAFFLVFGVAWLFYILIESPCTRLAKNVSGRIMS